MVGRPWNTETKHVIKTNDIVQHQFMNMYGIEQTYCYTPNERYI